MSSTKLEPNQYQCAECLGVFEKGWDDTEADAEYQERFGVLELPPEDVAVVCDDCYEKMMKRLGRPNV